MTNAKASRCVACLLLMIKNEWETRRAVERSRRDCMWWHAGKLPYHQVEVQDRLTHVPLDAALCRIYFLIEENDIKPIISNHYPLAGASLLSVLNASKTQTQKKIWSEGLGLGGCGMWDEVRISFSEWQLNNSGNRGRTDTPTHTLTQTQAAHNSIWPRSW